MNFRWSGALVLAPPGLKSVWEELTHALKPCFGGNAIRWPAERFQRLPAKLRAGGLHPIAGGSTPASQKRSRLAGRGTPWQSRESPEFRSGL